MQNNEKHQNHETGYLFERIRRFFKNKCAVKSRTIVAGYSVVNLTLFQHLLKLSKNFIYPNRIVFIWSLANGNLFLRIPSSLKMFKSTTRVDQCGPVFYSCSK